MPGRGNITLATCAARSVVSGPVASSSLARCGSLRGIDELWDKSVIVTVVESFAWKRVNLRRCGYWCDGLW